VFQLRRLLAFPTLIAFALTDAQSTIEGDVARWAKIENRPPGTRRSLVDLIAERPQFRNLFYHRLWYGNIAGRVVGRVCFIALPQERTLLLDCDDIGPGLYIQHGFATIVGAERIGARVWISQQVTIGATVTDEATMNLPTLEDGATIYAGAKVIGNVRVGRDATVGANAVVTKDVPDGMVAVGVPAVSRERGRHARNRD
jgi:serine O-acetyltransferase